MADGGVAAEQRFWRNAKETFLRSYNPDPNSKDVDPLMTSVYGQQTRYHALCILVEAICKDLLEPLGILHQASSRVKTYESLAKKVTAVLAELRDNKQIQGSQSAEAKEAIAKELEAKIKDRAGARVLLYFPDDISKVVSAIRGPELCNNCKTSDDRELCDDCNRRLSDFVIQDDKISVTRSRKYQPNDDQVEYADGAFLSEPVDADEIINQTWKHYGYRAVHLIVKLSKKGQDKALDLFNSRRQSLLPKTFVEFMNYKLEVDGGPDFSEYFKHFVGSKTAEIQLSTVVMHAWSQVEHDIVYKTLSVGIPTERINRMLDGVNGLSITSEILLQELREANHQSASNFEELSQKHFEDEAELDRWLRTTYHCGKDKWEWKDAPQYSNLLWETMLRVRGPGSSWHCDLPITRRGFDNRMKAYGLLDHTPRLGEKCDASLLLLSALPSPDHLFDTFDPAISVHMDFHPSYQSILYTLFMVANSFSIMVSIAEREAVKRLEKRFPDRGLKSMKQINGIFTCTLPEPADLAELDSFAKDYLKADWCEIHDLAMALTRLNYVILHDCNDAHHFSGMEIYAGKYWKAKGFWLVTFCLGQPQKMWFSGHRIPINRTESNMGPPHYHRMTQCFSRFYGRTPKELCKDPCPWHASEEHPAEVSSGHESEEDFDEASSTNETDPGIGEGIRIAPRIHVGISGWQLNQLSPPQEYDQDRDVVGHSGDQIAMCLNDTYVRLRWSWGDDATIGLKSRSSYQDLCECRKTKCKI